MKEKAADGRLVQFRLPTEIALKLEVFAASQGLSLNQYCKKKALGENYQDTQVQISEIHKMVKFLFDNH
ncbi:toxin-antitoxin system HicB family antitoxin [Acinetobacter pittii]|uniref:toxin-antitoxin system HicB family antitoxin n=1 Tax=Acinetobacter pittii TaxID=48296 RepID=UPI00325FEA0D